MTFYFKIFFLLISLKTYLILMVKLNLYFFSATKANTNGILFPN